MTAKAARCDPSHAERILPVLPRFAHIHRSWDEAMGSVVAKLLPGDYYVTRHAEMIVTVLGSCVSACVRDRKLGIGGMNHFMLPQDCSAGAGAWADIDRHFATRYGDVAMQSLVKDILECGGQRSDLEFKLVGGGKVLDMGWDVGSENVGYVRRYMKAEGFAISAEDLGDRVARKVYYSPETGKMLVKRLTSNMNQAVFELERQSAPLAWPAPGQRP